MDKLESRIKEDGEPYLRTSEFAEDNSKGEWEETFSVVAQFMNPDYVNELDTYTIPDDEEDL